jgi:hypothetical protein
VALVAGRAGHQPQNREGAGITIPPPVLARADEVIEQKHYLPQFLRGREAEQTRTYEIRPKSLADLQSSLGLLGLTKGGGSSKIWHRKVVN